MSEPLWVARLITDSRANGILPFVAVARTVDREFIRYRESRQRAEEAIDALCASYRISESYVVELVKK